MPQDDKSRRFTFNPDMCGFAGVVAWDDRYRVSRETLGRMSAAIAHRGPDGEGYHINHEGEATADRPQVALAFRRLAILDPDPRSNQPFTDGRHWLVFNGEIYNFRELRAELTSLDPSYEWRTSGDTEVLLRAYAIWREACTERLDGMYAFVVWDEREKSAFVVRDRMGQKPLYFGIAPETGALSFASELPAITALPWFRGKIEMDSVAQYLRWGYIPPARTIYEGIYKLAASHSFAAARAVVERPARWSYCPEHVLLSATYSRSSATTHAAIKAAVKRQLVSDVPVGCFLSGGVDSSVIAAAMAQVAPRDQPPMTFSIGFDDPRYDESRYAAAVAKHLGTRHHAFHVRPDAAADLPALARVFGEPFADSSALPTHYLARETRRYVKVALSGDGGDELFGGYERYRAMALGEWLRRLPPSLAAVATSPAWQKLPGTHPKARLTRLKRFVAGLADEPPQRYASYVRLFSEGLLAELWSGALALSEVGPDRTFAASWNMYSNADVVAAAMRTDQLSYLPEDLHTKVDRASMLHALEVRAPFMDQRVVHMATRGVTGESYRRLGPKGLLREAFAADLPDFVFKRKKMGFAVPIGEWFRGELRPMLRDHLFASDSFAKQHFNMPVVERLVDEHEQSRVDHSQRLYALLMLELWWKLHSL